MAKLQFIKRAQFAPSVTSICLIQADIYSSGRQKYVFLTFTNPEGLWHHEGIAKITPYNEDKKPLKSFGLRIDLTMVPPGGFFSYPEEIPLPIEAEDFNFEFLKIDGIQAPEYTPVRAFEDETVPSAPAPAPTPAPQGETLGGMATLGGENPAEPSQPAYEGPAPEPVREQIKKGGKKGAKHIEIIDFGHRTMHKRWIFPCLAGALLLGVGSAVIINQYPVKPSDGTEAFLLYKQYRYNDRDCYSIEDALQSYEFGNYIVPKEHNGLPILIVNNGAFDYCVNLTGIALLNVEYIGSKAFEGCENLTKAFISIDATVAPDAFPSWTKVIIKE